MNLLDLSKSYFELFDLPEHFQVDLNKLKTRQQQLQSQVHPDRFVSADAKQQREALEAAALVNEAYQTLNSPIRRAIYILQRHGQEMEQGSVRDPQFLMEQMELREELEALDSQPESLDKVIKFNNKINKITSEVEESINFENPNANQLDDIKDQVRKLQFLTRLQEQTQNLIEKLEEALI